MTASKPLNGDDEYWDADSQQCDPGHQEHGVWNRRDHTDRGPQPIRQPGNGSVRPHRQQDVYHLLPGRCRMRQSSTNTP